MLSTSAFKFNLRRFTLAKLEDAPGMPCDISARIEAWPEAGAYTGPLFSLT
jgi:hypothetical protein